MDKMNKMDLEDVLHDGEIEESDKPSDINDVEDVEDTLETLRKKKRLGQLVKQFIAIKNEEERKEFIKEYGKKIREEIRNHTGKKYEERDLEQILSEFEIVDYDDIPDASEFEESDLDDDDLDDDELCDDAVDELGTKEKKALKQKFDLLCLERLKKVIGEEKLAGMGASVDEQLLKQIHASETYKKYFDNSKNFTSEFAKSVLNDGTDIKVVKGIMDEYLKTASETGENNLKEGSGHKKEAQIANKMM